MSIVCKRVEHDSPDTYVFGPVFGHLRVEIELNASIPCTPKLHKQKVNNRLFINNPINI